MDYLSAHVLEPELRDGPPRRVRFTGRALLTRRLVWNLALAACALLYFLSSRELGHLRALAARGIAVPAVVIDKTISSGKATTYRVHYEYRTAGRVLDDRMAVRRVVYDSTSINDPLTITCLPDAPEIHRVGLVGPERVRERWNAWSLGWLFALLVAAGTVGGTEWHLRQRRELLARGIAVAGVVTERRTTEYKNSVTHYLKYTYRYRGVLGDWTGDGEAVVTQARYEAHPEGTSLTVLYRPDAPERSAPYVTLSEAEIEGAPTRRLAGA